MVKILEVKKELGNAIKRQRGRLGITQEELAERAGLERRTVTNTENAKSEPKYCSVYKIMRALPLSTEDLFYDGSDESSAFVNEILIELSDCSASEREYLFRMIRTHKTFERKMWEGHGIHEEQQKSSTAADHS